MEGVILISGGFNVTINILLLLLLLSSYEETVRDTVPMIPCSAASRPSDSDCCDGHPIRPGIQLQSDRFNVLVYGYARGETPSPRLQSPGTGYQRVLKVKAR
jgi:hypothetical protein